MRKAEGRRDLGNEEGREKKEIMDAKKDGGEKR